MNDFIKEKLIKSILEADMIIEEINNKYWEEKIIRITGYICFFCLSFFFIKSYLEDKERSKENNK